MGEPNKQHTPIGPEDLEDSLYDPIILSKLDWSNVKHMNNGITSSNPGPGLRVRPLCKADYDRGYLELLAQLTKVGDISKEQFYDQFDLMKKCPEHYYITVIEDITKGTIIASATLAVELKFIRGCARRGRLEDVVVSPDYRGMQLGKLIVSTITLLAKQTGCYKMGLDCKDSLKGFYSVFGYVAEEGNDNTMVIRF